MLAEIAAADPSAHETLRKQAAVVENTNAHFWKIERTGLATSYLLGTIHMSDPRITTLTPSITDALVKSKSVVLEIADLSDGALMAAIATSNADLMYTDGTSLEQKLTPEEFEKVKTVTESNGVPKEAAGMFKPWLVSTMMSVSQCERNQLAAGAKVLDMKLADEAKALGIPVVGLETINQQLDALSSVPETDQLDMLRVSLKYADRIDDLSETMLQLYLKHDIGAAMPFQYLLAGRMGVPPSTFANFETAVLYDRNSRMAASALSLLDKGAVFVAVGALHLPGKSGLVTLLRQAGYTLTPIE